MRSPLILVLLLSLALGGCTTSPTKPIANATPAPTETHSSGATTHGHWSYHGETGPEHWGNLGDELNGTYELCGSGATQSPINIATTTTEDLANIILHYEPKELILKNNGHTVEVHYAGGGYIELDQQRYATANIHYHAPSEHTVDGKSFDAELHLVHARDAGEGKKELAVIGILLTSGAENANYRTLLANLPHEEGEEIASQDVIDAASLLPTTQTTYRYSGSLTTPPCTEGVHWNVMTTPVELSPEQLASLKQVFEGNNRPVQQAHTPKIIEDATP